MGFVWISLRIWMSRKFLEKRRTSCFRKVSVNFLTSKTCLLDVRENLAYLGYLSVLGGLYA